MERSQTLFPPIFLRLTTTTTSNPFAAPTLPVVPPPPSVVYAVFDRPSSHSPHDVVTALSPATLSGTGGTRFLNEGWAIALTALTSVRLVLTLCLWAYLTYRTVQLRVCLARVWLSQLLLGSLALSHVVLFAFVTQPTPTSCAIVRLGVGLAYVLPLAVLVLKLVLIAATQRGYDVPRFCQILFLVGFVGIQMGIGIQWLTLVTPGSSHRLLPTGGATCGISIFDWLQHLIYVKVLLVIGTILAVVTHDSKANHREALFLGISLGSSIPIYMVWALTGSLLRDRTGIEDKCVAFGLLAITTLILFIMFIPRSRQSVAIGEGGLYIEDDSPIDKPISELTVHKLYYPVYKDQKQQQQQHKTQRVSFVGTSVSNAAASNGGHGRAEGADGVDDLRHEDISETPHASHHWYPPLRDTVHAIGNGTRGGGRSLYPTNNRLIRPYHYPSMASTSSASSPTNACHFDDITSVHRIQASSCNGELYLGSAGGLKGRCLTPPSEEGSTTPSDGQDSIIGGGASNDESDVDIANFTERNVDGVSYSKVSRMPMY